MRLTKKEQSSLSDAIDQMNEALEVFIEMYNDSIEDKPLFDEEVQEMIEKARTKFGEEEVNKKINSIIKETLGWLPLENIDED